MKLRFAPFWYDRFPQRRRPAFPRHRTTLETRVAVVGGGLAGCACACALASARVPVVLLEADRIGAGATAGDVGLVREDFDIAFTETVGRAWPQNGPSAVAGDAPGRARFSDRAPPARDQVRPDAAGSRCI